MKLTRRQQEIYAYLQSNVGEFPYPPTYDELCQALGLSSRGALHKQIQALVEAGLIESSDGRQGIRLVEQERKKPGIAAPGGHCCRSTDRSDNPTGVPAGP